MQWDRPPERVRELMRQGAERIVNLPQEWLEELHQATLSSEYMRRIAGDPVLVEATRRSNRANLLHWAAANISHPGDPVPANLGPETLDIARDLIRRGMDESAIDAYRIGQNVAWRFWMQIAFDLTSDPQELRELLDVSARSIASFIDATIAGMYTQIEAEREELTGGAHAERREAVTLILDGAPITRQRAESRLGYRLNQTHTAAVIWGNESDTDLSDLDRAADALMQTAVERPLGVLASAATRWVWIPGRQRPDLTRVSAALQQLPGVRIALGSTAAGIEGFRRSHLDAITTQRMMARLGSPQRIAGFTDVELVALITADPERADGFIKHTLGDFESAGAELHESVLTFVTEQCNASRAAARLYTHRNTLLRRLARADEMLPQPLQTNGVHVAVALEALRWHGGPSA
jgi:DNA-binding PucR family transcriptional regulator